MGGAIVYRRGVWSCVGTMRLMLIVDFKLEKLIDLSDEAVHFLRPDILHRRDVQ